MGPPTGIEIGLATPADTAGLMHLYQGACARIDEDTLFVERRRLADAVGSDHDVWVVARRGPEVAALVSFRLEPDHQLAKVYRMYRLPDLTDAGRVQKEAILFAMEHMRAAGLAEVVYTTTRALTLEEQELTLELGYRTLGVFPNAMGSDRSRLNGLTAHFFDGTLTRRRYTHFALHPLLSPLYEIVRRECALDPLVLASPPAPAAGQDPPALEVIQAPAFVAHRFARLAERKFLTVSFYPFARPTALITDPAQTIEVFSTIVPALRFATIIGERIEVPVDPVALYRQISTLLHGLGVTYIEVINDAADVNGVDCIMRAGYVPCAYFPCLKNHGEHRRDYVVFCRSFEAPTYVGAGVRPIYVEYFREFLRLQQRALIPEGWL